jgi:Secretion system C-terminal sorting domain
LAYALITPMAGPGEPVPNYIFPDGIAPADENKIYFNTETGEFKWDAPVLPGHYGIAILVKAYRNGQLVEQVIRDLSIEVLPDANTPPEIVLNPDINPETVLDVFVGQNLDWSMSANDPDPGQSVELSATGGPLEDFFANAAVFVANGNTANFSWSLQPEHVRQPPYQVVFKAKDDFQGNGLARTRVVRFRVNGTTAVQTPSLPLNVFPNPAVRQVDIQLPEALAENATLRVINAKGQCWHQQTLAAGARNHTLQLAEAPAGWYVLEVRTTRGGRFLGKLQKQ